MPTPNIITLTLDQMNAQLEAADNPECPSDLRLALRRMIPRDVVAQHDAQRETLALNDGLLERIWDQSA